MPISSSKIDRKPQEEEGEAQLKERLFTSESGQDYGGWLASMHR